MYPKDELDELVKLRKQLLTAELRAAILSGRTADVGTIRAEWRALEAFPKAVATMRRVGIGRCVAFARELTPQSVQLLYGDATRRMAELTAEMKRYERR